MLHSTAELHERKYELANLDDLRFILRWIEKGEEMVISHVIRERKGIERLVCRMLGLTTVVERFAYMAFHHELDLAVLVFVDEEGKELRTLSNDDAAGSGQQIRFELKMGAMDHPASECVPRRTAFQAVEAYCLEGNPPRWLQYRSEIASPDRKGIRRRASLVDARALRII